MKTETNKRLSFARIEYRAVQTLVEQKLAEGYSIRLIFEELTEAGRLTMTYTSLCDYIRGKGSRQHGALKKALKRPSAFNRGTSPAAAPKKIVPAAKSDPFTLEKVPLEELI
jgi:hypothetical protein